MIIKLKSKRQGQHVHESVFMGKDKDHLMMVGKLVLHIGEWQLFGVALLLGAEKMKRHLEVITEGDEAVVELTIIKEDEHGQGS